MLQVCTTASNEGLLEDLWLGGYRGLLLLLLEWQFFLGGLGGEGALVAEFVFVDDGRDVFFHASSMGCLIFIHLLLLDLLMVCFFK